jgi:hypothetical protein
MQGILVFASVMATLGLQIILESVRALLSDVSGFHFWKFTIFNVFNQQTPYYFLRRQGLLGVLERMMCDHISHFL